MTLTNMGLVFLADLMAFFFIYFEFYKLRIV